ncbi:MAG: Fe(2+) transporter permease subunit FeoB [Alphaproteobacteria bacterium]
MENQKTIALVGNPNCGKTALFNALTGSHQRVGNWPGVTVDKKVGDVSVKGQIIHAVDLPGIYTLGDGDTSLDERIARDFLMSGEVDIILNIVDINHLQRHLVLTSRLLEYGIPVIVVANMMDVARKNGSDVDLKALSEILSVPVIPMVACKKEGVEELKAEIHNAVENNNIPQPIVNFSHDVDQILSSLQQKMIENQEFNPLQLEGLSRQIIEDIALLGEVGENIDENIQAYGRQVVADYKAQNSINIEDMMNQKRFQFASITQNKVYKKRKAAEENWIDKIVLNRFLGIPIFLGVMYLLFMFSVQLGNAFVDFFDIAAGAIFVDGFRVFLENIGLPEILIIILADGFGAGLQTVITFIPVIGFLFLFLSFLEDCGYLARAAFVIDRLMSNLGLPGKAFVPLITGFGCTVSAVMGARTLDQHRDRVMTTAMAPFMSCGARLPVYVFFATVFFPSNGQNLVFGLYLLGIGMAVVTGLLLQKTILKSKQQPMVIEIPRWHMPISSNVLRYSWQRLKGFLTRASRVIIPMVAVLTILNSVTFKGEITDAGSENAALATIGKTITPIFSPMGIKEENWPATVGVFTGILAKEALVGTLDALYSQIDGLQETAMGEEEEAFSLMGSLEEAAASIPANLGAILSSWSDPMGIHVDNVSNLEEAAEAQEVAVSSFNAMKTYYYGTIGAFAYLVFILLYMPCSAATAAIIREEGMKWGLFVAAWSNILAWISATIIFQIGTFNQHVASSSLWIGACVAFMIIFWIILVYISRNQSKKPKPISSEAMA